MTDLPSSFSQSGSDTVTGPGGQRVHRDSLAHSERLQRKLWTVRPGVWCLVGNGLSNQTFVEGPEGVIAIDTGECVEEMESALAELRTVTQSPVVAAFYTHSHYVGGTAALPEGIPIWGHERIVQNLQAYGAEFSAIAGSGLVHQFGMTLPSDGEDGLVNVGLGLAFRFPDHAPFTPGFIEPTEIVSKAVSASVAGLQVEFSLAPSDSDDSLTISFPDLDLVVHNLVWPTLFNVFAIRGEQYRDPRVLLDGIDHILELRPEFLAGSHGPPLSGQDRIQTDVTQYRDSIQFLWDQTVRGINKGMTSNELTRFVQLPGSFERTYLTSAFYGVAEHHVRQIHAGLRGWFDGDESNLFPLHPADRAQRIVAGFGGAEAVRTQVNAALEDDELRWALELAATLVTSGLEVDKPLLATVLRTIAGRTTAANIRNWCLTRARELDGLDNLDRFRNHRFNAHQIRTSPPEVFVHTLRVLLDPVGAAGVDSHLCWEFPNGRSAGLHIRNHVAVPTNGEGASNTIRLDLDTWALILTNKQTLEEAFAQGALAVDGDETHVREFLRCFDHPTLGAA